MAKKRKENKIIEIRKSYEEEKNYETALDTLKEIKDAGYDAIEMQKVNENQTAYEIIVEETDPAYVNFEFDSYWMTDAGVNVPELMEKMGNRIKLWHINGDCNRKWSRRSYIGNTSKLDQ